MAKIISWTHADKDGNSNNPKVYEDWLEMKKQIPTDMFIGVFDQYSSDDK